MGTDWSRTVAYHGNWGVFIAQILILTVNFSQRILAGDLGADTTFIAINPALLIANAGVIYAIQRIEDE